MSIQVVNRKDGVKTGDIYIGRGSPLGNPYPMNNQSDSERVRVIEQCRLHFNSAMADPQDNEIKKELLRIQSMIRSGENIRLSCFCAPKACHGDLIKRYLEHHTKV